MTSPSPRRWPLIALGVLALAAAVWVAWRTYTGDDLLSLSAPPDAGATTVAALDSLARLDPLPLVALAGTVEEQDGPEALLLDDGTGVVAVLFRDDLPPLQGQRLLVRGRLALREGAPVVKARSWHYDSTAASIRSPVPDDRSARRGW